MLISLLISVEIFCLCTAAYCWFKSKGNTFAEAGSYAIVTVFMLLSFVRQIFFITGGSILSAGVEIFFLMASIVMIFNHRKHIPPIFQTLKMFGLENPLCFLFLILCFLYMAVHSLLSVPEAFQNEFNTIRYYEKTGFFTLAAASEGHRLIPVNHLILFNTFFRFDLAAGAGFFCFLAYLSIGFSTYALARRYSWPPTAVTTAVLVLSMPRLVVQAMSPGTQILSIAVALFCILAIYRSVELPNQTDLIFLILGLLFFISENISAMIFLPLLFVLSWVVLSRRHGSVVWKSILGTNRYAIIAVVPMVVFSQSWIFLCNSFYKASLPGLFSDVLFNTDGIQGAISNFIRYVFEGFYSIACLDRFSFGPAGFFLVLPALVYALLKGPRRLKAFSLAFFVYFYLVSLILAWAPGNIKFFDIFYICAGFSIAFFFPPWRFTKRKLKFFQAIGCLLLFLTLFYI